MDATTKVLVVDDEEVVRRAYLRILSAIFDKVEAVANGSEALRAMENESRDLVLLDVRLPGIDGMEVLKTIKEKWPESEVVMITAYPVVDAAKEAIQLGAYDYLAKPLDPDEMIRTASGAMMQKRWSLRRDRQGQDGQRKRPLPTDKPAVQPDE